MRPATLVPVPRTLVGMISVAWTHMTYQPTFEDNLNCSAKASQFSSSLLYYYTYYVTKVRVNLEMTARAVMSAFPSPKCSVKMMARLGRAASIMQRT